MKKTSICVLIFGFSIYLMMPGIAFAASTPSLGMAESYAILANTYTNTLPGSTINGDIGYTTGPALRPDGLQQNYGSGDPYSAAGVDQGIALAELNSESCTFTFPDGAIDLSTDTTHGAIGVYTPGVYCSNGAMNIGGSLTLSGSGTYIFKAIGALTSTAGSSVVLAGASACDVFWVPTEAASLAANTTFRGTIIANAGITVGANTSWTGRALSFLGTVSTDADDIDVPSCIVFIPEFGFFKFGLVIISCLMMLFLIRRKNGHFGFGRDSNFN